MTSEFIKYIERNAVAAYRLKNLHYENPLFSDLLENNVFWSLKEGEDAEEKLEYIRREMGKFSDEIYAILLDLSDGHSSYD